MVAGRLRAGNAKSAGDATAAALFVASCLGVATLALLALFGERLNLPHGLLAQPGGAGVHLPCACAWPPRPRSC